MKTLLAILFTASTLCGQTKDTLRVEGKVIDSTGGVMRTDYFLFDTPTIINNGYMWDNEYESKQAAMREKAEKSARFADTFLSEWYDYRDLCRAKRVVPSFNEFMERFTRHFERKSK